MARYRPINSEMWSSQTIRGYTGLQLAIFFYYHTRPEATESGVQRVDLIEESRRFQHDNHQPLTQSELISEIEQMPENFELDLDNRLIFCKQFFQHNGMRLGSPILIAKSVVADMRRNPKSKVWNTFTNLYQTFSKPYSDLISSLNISLQASHTNHTDTRTYRDSEQSYSDRLGKGFANLCQPIIEMISHKGGSVSNKEGGYKGGRKREEGGDGKTAIGLQKVSNTIPEAVLSAQVCKPDGLAVGEDLLSKSSFIENKSAAVAAYLAELKFDSTGGEAGGGQQEAGNQQNPSEPIPESRQQQIISSKSFQSWLLSNHVPNKKLTLPSLASVMPAEQAAHLLEIMPSITPAQAFEKLIAFKGCSPETIFNAFVHNVAAPAKAAYDHPMLQKAASPDGLDRADYLSLPFLFRDLVCFNDSKERYFLK